MLRRALRLVVHARRAQRLHSARVTRRISRIAGRALLFGVAPSVANDYIVEHKFVDTYLVAHECAMNSVTAVLATSLQDVFLVLRALRATAL